MKQELDCPNCGNHHVAYDSVWIRCSGCGMVVFTQAAAKVYSDRIESEHRNKLRSKKVTKARLFVIPFVIEMCIRSIGFFSLVLCVPAVVWLIDEIKRQQRLRLVRIAIVHIFLFLIGTIAGDSLAADCALQ